MACLQYCKLMFLSCIFLLDSLTSNVIPRIRLSYYVFSYLKKRIAIIFIVWWIYFDNCQYALNYLSIYQSVAFSLFFIVFKNGLNLRTSLKYGYPSRIVLTICKIRCNLWWCLLKVLKQIDRKKVFLWFVSHHR